MRFRRILSIVTVVVAAVLGVVGVAVPAQAHAQLIDTTPASGAELATAPTHATLHFGEAVRPVAGGIRLLDETGKRIQLPSPKANGATVTQSLPAMAAGAYVVSWRVVSADGHPVRGAFTFRVGGTGSQQAAARAATALFASEKGRTDVGAASALLRALSFLSMMLLIGLAGLLLVDAIRTDTARLVLGNLTTAGMALALASGVGSLLIYGPYVSGSGFGALRDGVLLDDTLHDTVGRALVTRTVLLLVLALLIREALRTDHSNMAPRWTALGMSFAVGVAQAYTGHGAAGRWSTASIASTSLHVVAAGVWVGGLLALVVVRLRGIDDDERHHALARFSMLALWAVAGLVLSGVFASLRQVGTVDALTTTTMGRLLIAKVALVAAMVALGARNRRDVAAGAVVQRVRIEAALSIGVIVLTTLLTGTAPARDVIARPVSVTLKAQTLLVDLTVDPAKRGRNEIHLYALRPDGQPLKVEAITATASLPSKGIENLPLKMLRAGSNHFQVLGVDLPLAGTWRIDAQVRVDTFTEESASTSVVIR